ncbi:MAG: zinc-dependent alcohol dehydrogenase [Candidatus Dormibacteria bacterium]
MTANSLTVLDGGDTPMRALVLDSGAERRGAGGRRLQLRDIARPVPPAPGWVLVRPSLAGINARDLALLAAGQSLPPVGAPRPLPMVPGCEVVGVVEAVNRTRWAREGQRVLVEPNAGCMIRGFPTCSRCAAGETELCENRDLPSLVGLGADGGLAGGGGWSEGVLAHEEMLIPADGISDQRGVLGVSLASAIHAVLRWGRRGERVAVIGSGTTTRLVVAALRRLHPSVDITVMVDARGPHRLGRRRRKLPSHLAIDDHGSALALGELGAARVWRDSPAQLLDRTAELVGARRRRTAGDDLPVLDRGLDAVFDCRGTAASVTLGMRLLRSGGTMVVAGRAGRVHLDWSAVWSRELTIAGSGGFGIEPAGWRTFAAVREWLTDPSFPADSLVTHRYPLDAYETAIATAAAGEAMGAVKVVFEDPMSPLRQRRLAIDTDLPVDDGAAPMLLGGSAARGRR